MRSGETVLPLLQHAELMEWKLGLFSLNYISLHPVPSLFRGLVRRRKEKGEGH